MPNKRSAGSFCSLVVGTTGGTSKSVESLDVSALGPGAQVYCLANHAIYSYDLGSAQTNLAGTDAFVQPLSGGGCWFKLGADGAYSTRIESTGLGIITSTGVWQALPVSSNISYANVNLNPFFPIDAGTGIMTYEGPSGSRFLIMATLVVNSASAVSSVIEMDLSINGSLIGSTTQLPSSVFYSQGVLSQSVQLVQNYQGALVNGQTIQHVLRITGTAAAQTINRYQVSILNIDG